MKMGKVAIIMGSSSDLPIMQQAIDLVAEFGVEHVVDIVSAHRTPEYMVSFTKTAKRAGVRVIIAGAGGAAHLPGMVASLSPLPVIGVPINSSNSIEGIDSLLSIVQMPAGIPVATVAINGAKNAGLLAIRILALQDEVIAGKYDAYVASLQKKVEHQRDSLKDKATNKATSSNQGFTLL